MRLHVFNEYTYTLETLIQAGQKGMAVTSVPVRVNAPLRPSRLFQSVPVYVSAPVADHAADLRHVPAPSGFSPSRAEFCSALACLIGLRFVYYFLATGGAGHVQSLILASLLMAIGFFLGVVGILADIIAVNRQLLEKLNWRMHELEARLANNKKPG